MPMKTLYVRVPERIYEELKRLKKEKKIKSMSEFVRNVLTLYMEYGGQVVVKRKISIEEEWRPIQKKELTPEERGWIGYKAEVRAELMAQLKKALAERRKKLNQLTVTN